MESNVVVEWFTLLFRREVSDSNIVPQTGYPVWGISWFFSVTQVILWDSALN
jgi:hypothetical protein